MFTRQFKFASLSTLKSQKGMTLLEIIIVVTILASLVAVLGSQVSKMNRKAKVKEAQIQMGELAKALDMYNNDCGHYPSSSDGLAALAPGGESTCQNWGPEPYIKKIPKDPWGTEFQYFLEGSNFVIISLGADKKEGGTGYDKDLSSND
jgi:general secretion pathway protein G